MPTLTEEQYGELEKMGCTHQMTEEELEEFCDKFNKELMEKLEGSLGELIKKKVDDAFACSRVVVDEENGRIICDKLFPPYDKIII